MDQTSLEDPAYHAAVVDLLGVLAYGELTAFIRMAVDSDAAPTLTLKSALAGLANTEYVQYRLLVDHMTARGIDAEAAMAPFLVPFAAYHERTCTPGVAAPSVRNASPVASAASRSTGGTIPASASRRR